MKNIYMKNMQQRKREKYNIILIFITNDISFQ